MTGGDIYNQRFIVLLVFGFGFQALGVKTAPVKLGKASSVSSVSGLCAYRPTWYTGSSTSSSRMVCVMAGQKADDTFLFFHQLDSPGNVQRH